MKKIAGVSLSKLRRAALNLDDVKDGYKKSYADTRVASKMFGKEKGGKKFKYKGSEDDYLDLVDKNGVKSMRQTARDVARNANLGNLYNKKKNPFLHSKIDSKV